MTESTGDLSIPGLDRIELERRVEASQERVWHCWAEPTLVARWWGDHVNLDLRVGGAFTESWRDSDGRAVRISGAVILCQAPRSFALTWTDDDSPTVTEVMVRLRREGAGRADPVPPRLARLWPRPGRGIARTA